MGRLSSSVLIQPNKNGTDMGQIWDRYGTDMGQYKAITNEQNPNIITVNGKDLQVLQTKKKMAIHNLQSR